MISLRYLTLIIIISTSVPLYGDSESVIKFEDKLTNLEKLINDAEKVNGLWRDTKKLMSQAIEEHKNNNTSQALELLELAEQQANSGYQQAISQNDIDLLIPGYLKPDL